MKKILTIAGSDSSGGAGVQADLKTFSAFGEYGMSVITAVTAQNTQGVTDIYNITIDSVKKQIKAVFEDIEPDAVKIGMLSNKEIVMAVYESLKEFGAKNIVLDPVMVSTSGFKLLDEDCIEALTKHLFSLATVITPNMPEASVLLNREINTVKDMEKAALDLQKPINGNILIKGGHLHDRCTDILCCRGEITEFTNEKIDANNTHGTGCTLSSAIALMLARGYDVKTAVKEAKDYVYGAIKNAPDFGKGSGPLNHFWRNK